jgi:hypothetical protein
MPTNYVKLKYFDKYYILIPIGIVRFYSIRVRFRTNKEMSWLQRDWRPITMITFLFLMVMDSFGLLSFRLSGDAPQCGVNVATIADWIGWLCCWEEWGEDSAEDEIIERIKYFIDYK